MNLAVVTDSLARDIHLHKSQGRDQHGSVFTNACGTTVTSHKHLAAQISL